MADRYDNLDRLASFYVQGDQPVSGLLPLQIDVSAPDVEGLERGTGLLNPSLSFEDQTKHFPLDLYDLRPQTHLTRFLQSLLGPSGTGQLLKRNLVARISSILGGANFFDIDALYGSIFGDLRRVEEKLPFDPMDSVATPEEWDEVIARDSQLRTRIESLAKAIPLGGTVPGILQAAEAVVGAPCEVYEIWKLLDTYGTNVVATNTWDDVETAFPTWNDFTLTLSPLTFYTWAQVNGESIIGGSISNNPAEVIVRPKKTYADTPEGDLEKIQDNLGLVRVLSKLQPAGTFITVDEEGLALHQPVAIAGIYSDDNYKQIIERVSPLAGYEETYLVSDGASLEIPDNYTGARQIPKPPFYGTLGHKHTVLPNFTGANSYALNPDGSTVSNNWDHLGPYGTVEETFVPEQGLSDARTLAAALLAENSGLISHTYAGARSTIEDVI